MATPAEIEAHREACADFGGAIVNWGAGARKRPSPCTEWTAGDIVEHVVGSHEVLLLRSVRLNPVGRRDETTERWNVTSVVIDSALEELANQPQASSVKNKKFASLPALTVDVLVHTWDRARALGIVVSLNAQLCASALTYVKRQPSLLRTEGERRAWSAD